MHYNVVNSYVFANGVDIYKFKSKVSEINAALLYYVYAYVCVYIYDFSVYYDSTDVAGI